MSGGVAYERPERLATDGAAQREFAKLNRSLGRATARRDKKSVAYLTGRIARLRAARIERGAW